MNDTATMAPDMPTPIGDRAADKVSFLPADYVNRKIESRTNVICLSLFGVVLIAVVGAYMVTAGQRAAVLTQQKLINASFADAAKRIQQLDELQAQKKDLLHKAQVTATLVEPVPRSNLLAELINRSPESVTLQELELKSRKLMPANPLASARNGSAMAAARQAANTGPEDAHPAAPAFEAPRFAVEVSVVGVAPTDIQVAQYMASLARCELLTDVDLVFSEETRVTDLAMRKFRIDMKLDESADVRSIEPMIAERDEAGFADLPFLNPNSTEKD